MYVITACGIETPFSATFLAIFFALLHVCHYRLRYWNTETFEIVTRHGGYMYVITACGIETASANGIITFNPVLHVCHYRLRYWNYPSWAFE